MAVMPIGSAIRWLAEQDPDRPAITDDARTATRLELDRRTNRLARQLKALGVGQDDFVTIGVPNSVDFYETAVAAWKLGATPQPVSHRLPQRERDEIVALAGAAAVVLEPLALDLSVSDEPLPERTASSFKAPTSGGSTGRPKIIVSGSPGVVDPEAAGGFGMDPNGVQLVPGPLYHNAPFQFSCNGLLKGQHLIVMSRFDASRALQLMEEHRVTWVLMVPTMMHRIWRLPAEEREGRDLSALKGMLHLAAPCPPWLKAAWIDWLGPERVWELYAGTEAQGVTIISGQDWLDHRGSVGRPTPGTMRILDADGNELPPGEIGEVWMKPPEGRTTYRYIGADARTMEGGWESLGDMGSMDANGFLYLADRRTDMILVGGSNVYPAEVESALDEHPAVRSCAVIGMPDDDMGHRVHAVIEAGDDVTDDDLRRFLAERLVPYKIPRSFERVDSPVRDDAGKVRRSGLQAERAETP